jgi:hypothetical protein
MPVRTGSLSISETTIAVSLFTASFKNSLRLAGAEIETTQGGSSITHGVA